MKLKTSFAKKLQNCNIGFSNLTLSANPTEWSNTLKQLGLIDSNGIRTHNHFVHKRTLNHLASLAKCLSVRL